MSGEHASMQLISRYALGDLGIPGDELFSIESHLETCAVCRGRLAEVVDERAPSVGLLLDSVWSELEPAAKASGQMPAEHRLSRWLTTWASPSVVPWLGMSALVVALAWALTWAFSSGSSVVLLLAPVLPLLGVAASWARGLDPAFELVVATPRAGLYLVLRRTLAVLAVVIPLLLVIGTLSHTSPELWLLPCLGYTAGTLALGGVIGIGRAAGVLAVLWVAFVVAPSVAEERLSIVMDPRALPVWGAVLVAAAVVVVVRSRAYARLGSQL
ncbi:MAG: putative transporter permease protein [Amycolatopsis sp.]|jgi:hypothetical protein|uniref:zf-HC2 domain-containing protein n=1 Tax=Amycolatopsis sp. TaxID=37632 RepID=UPI0026077E1F|nr:zf-HC2 domain-containing protein [Amycolatopsis sp.]MCU1680982.1 putative transporter permease protein [Amycolatopsis sp.]